MAKLLLLLSLLLIAAKCEPPKDELDEKVNDVVRMCLQFASERDACLAALKVYESRCDIGATTK